MLASLESVVDRLVAEYEPDRIILFGSQATGHASRDSDFDLLVVKETDRRPLDRRMDVERLLADRSFALDLLVYTPAEIHQLFAAGSPFIEEVFRTGKVLFMRNPTKTWMAQARDEFESADILLGNEKYQATCYHSQQCAEKVLKALLLERAAEVPRTHDLIELRNRVLAMGWDVSLTVDDAVFLNSIYRGRYPTEEGLLPYGEPSSVDAERACSAARVLLASADVALNDSGSDLKG